MFVPILESAYFVLPGLACCAILTLFIPAVRRRTRYSRIALGACLLCALAWAGAVTRLTTLSQAYNTFDLHSAETKSEVLALLGSPRTRTQESWEFRESEIVDDVWVYWINVPLIQGHVRATFSEENLTGVGRTSFKYLDHLGDRRDDSSERGVKIVLPSDYRGIFSIMEDPSGTRYTVTPEDYVFTIPTSGELRTPDLDPIYEDLGQDIRIAYTDGRVIFDYSNPFAPPEHGVTVESLGTRYSRGHSPTGEDVLEVRLRWEVADASRPTTQPAP